MNKKDLVLALAEKCHLSLAQAEKIIDAIFDTIQKAMIDLGSVTVPGFGSFSTKIREERKGRNPSTGQEMTIPRAIVPVFKPSSKLKEFVNLEDK